MRLFVIHKEHYHAYEFQLIPLFFEQQRYEIIIEPEENHTVEFWHENYNIRNKVTPTGRKGTLLTGEINFGNDIGFSDLLIKVDGNKVFKLTIEVFPSKISYKDDYKAIVADITTEYRMFYELKRRTEANVLNNNETVDGIEVEDFIISFDEGEILLSSEGKIRDKYAVQEFTKRPNLVFRRILDSMHNCSGDVSIE